VSCGRRRRWPSSGYGRHSNQDGRRMKSRLWWLPTVASFWLGVFASCCHHAFASRCHRELGRLELATADIRLADEALQNLESRDVISKGLQGEHRALVPFLLDLPLCQSFGPEVIFHHDCIVLTSTCGCRAHYPRTSKYFPRTSTCYPRTSKYYPRTSKYYPRTSKYSRA
jgi:hypothetical protein